MTRKGSALFPAATFTLDPKANPRTIDLTVTARNEKLVFRGIYTLDRGRLRILPFNDKAERPKEIKPGVAGPVLVCERVTDPCSDAGADALAALDEEAERLPADWQARRGKAKSPDERAKLDADLASARETVAGRLVQLAEDNPGRLVEIAALCRGFAGSPRSPAGKKALGRLAPPRLKEVNLAELRDVVDGMKDANEVADPQDREQFARVLFRRVEQTPTHADAAWMLNYLCGWSQRDQAKVPESFAGAAELIRKHHLASPDIANVGEYVGGILSTSAPAWAGQYETLLQAIARENRSRYVRGQARFALAKVALGAGEARQDEAIELFRAYQKEFDGKDSRTAGVENAQRQSADEHIKTIGALRIGKPAPEIEGLDTDGKPLKLSDYWGKVVMLSVWGTWCPPCMKFVPHERKLADRMKGKPFALIGINQDGYGERFRARMKKEGISWPSFRDKRKGKADITDELSLVFPSVVLIDHAGVVRGWWKGTPAPEALDQEIDKLVEVASKK
jgi:thiol-disulfide isomerase/thioredoxin